MSARDPLAKLALQDVWVRAGEDKSGVNVSAREATGV